MRTIILLFCFFLAARTFADSSTWMLPIKAANRQSLDGVALTAIGKFGVVRKARPGIPAHHHTGADFKRPGTNYANEPVFPAASGRVISLRADGAYAQIIIEHHSDSLPLWTVYEHIAGITVACGDTVFPERPIARFMTKAELDAYGWQFDHVHFEVMRSSPRPRNPDPARPSLFYSTYCLVCYNRTQLLHHYHDPLQFLSNTWQQITQVYNQQ